MNPDNPPKPNHQTVPVAFWAVAFIVIVCVGTAIFFIPSESQVMRRLSADGKIKRLREIVAEKTGHDPSDAELLSYAVNELGNNDWDDTGSQAIEKLTLNIADTEMAFEAIKQIEGNIPPKPAANIYSKLASRALATENPKLAATIFQHLGQHSGMSEQNTTDIVNSLRASSAPAEALATLTTFKEHNNGQLPDSFAELYDTLALESGQVNMAFDSARKNYENHKTTNPEQLRADIDKLITAGSHAGRTNELIPLCDEYLATTTAGNMTWLEIVAKRKADPSFDDKEFKPVAHEAAKFARWNNEPDKAFNLFRKLAALGDSEALGLCIELHKPLLRESEMADLLDAFIPVDGKPEYTLLAAQIHAKLTNYELADSLYRQHLAAHPEDSAAWLELGSMWDATSEFEPALEAYRKAADLDPHNSVIIDRITRTLISTGDFEAALELYAKMEKLDRKTVDRYINLASNLGDERRLNDALRKFFQLPIEHRPLHFKQLATSYRMIGQEENMLEVYRRAIQVFPQNRDLKIELAGELSRLRRHSEVMALIGKSNLRNDPEALSLHLSSAVASKQFQSGIAFSGPNPENRLTLPISAKLPLAEIYYQTGNVSKSNKIYDTIPKSELPVLTRATVAFRKGNFSESESLLRSHLNSNPKDHQSWTFLASVYQAQRKKPEAQAAYQRALSLLEVKTKRRS